MFLGNDNHEYNLREHTTALCVAVAVNNLLLIIVIVLRNITAFTLFMLISLSVNNGDVILFAHA